ncbi:MAG: hypothetical protein WCJ39_10965, partial [bacterium]
MNNLGGKFVMKRKAAKANEENAFKKMAIEENYQQGRDMNLLKMILSLESNNNNDINKPLSVFDIYMNMQGMKTSTVLRDSLQKSRAAFANPNLIKNSLLDLRINDPKSFLVVPLHGVGHLWCSLIKKSDEGYNVYITNKGLGFWHDTLEEHVYKRASIDKLVDTINYASTDTHNNIEDVYRKFEKNSDSAYTINIDASAQKVGNCYTKNIEASIKLADATSELSPEEMRGFRISRLKEHPYNKKTPEQKEAMTTLKWPEMSTEDVHMKFADGVAQRNQGIKRKVNYEVEKYTSNKLFREFLKAGKDPVESLIAAFDPDNRTEDMPRSERLKLLFKKVNDTVFDKSKKERDDNEHKENACKRDHSYRPQLDEIVMEINDPQY